MSGSISSVKSTSTAGSGSSFTFLILLDFRVGILAFLVKIILASSSPSVKMNLFETTFNNVNLAS